MIKFWSAIVNGAILSALLSATVWLAFRITPRRALNAATRYAIWWLVLALTLALPLSWMDAAVPASAATNRIGMPIQVPSGPLLYPMLQIWIACSLLFLMRVFVSYAAMHRRSARA